MPLSYTELSLLCLLTFEHGHSTINRKSQNRKLLPLVGLEAISILSREPKCVSRF